MSRDPSAFNCLGIIYRNGLYVAKNYFQAKYYFELAANQNDLNGLLNLGIHYLYGQGVNQDKTKAKNYFKLSAQFGNSYAFLYLGYCYEMEHNYLKAEKNYNLSSQKNNPEAYLYLGKLYKKGLGVQQDHYKAINYFELSSQLNNLESLFILGNYYSNGEFIELNIDKAINYYKKCSNFIYTKKQNLFKNYNIFCRPASNNLGLIYLLDLKDIDKANKYIKESAFAEYPYAQNNFGLLNQFYLHQDSNVKYMYEKSSNNQFSLSEYNLGYLYEKDGEIKKSIEYYIIAIEYENNPLIFHDVEIEDRRLYFSKIFIICYTNLKLADYYLSLNMFEESQKYFSQSLSKLEREDFSSERRFHVENNENENIFLFVKNKLIDLFNQQNLNLKNFNNCNSEKENHQMQYKVNDNIFHKNIEYKKANQQIENEIIFDDISKLFDFATKNETIKYKLAEIIHDILKIMKDILYTPPYSILFGRINISRYEKEKEKDLRENINQLFYDGLGIN